jgi:4-amino-4-deoxy-L-arabinose transferase-like glycosyltransferase
MNRPCKYPDLGIRKEHHVWLIAATAVLVVVQLFQNLDQLPVRLWDESRQAMNVLEMIHNEKYLVTHFSGEPDLWNTKPPLLIWIQLLLTKLFGFSEWSLRLPSALAGLLTALAISLFTFHKSRSVLLACLSAFILVSFSNYVGLHATRTGDYDALLTLWTTTYCLLFVVYLDTSQVKWLYLFSLSLILAVLTKGVAGLLFLPGLLVIILLNGKWWIFRNLGLYFNGILIVMAIASYYIFREMASEGYLAAVMNNELGGRFNSTIENHYQPFHFYFNHLLGSETIWVVMAFVGLYFGCRKERSEQRSILLTLLILTITFLVIISKSQTKLLWYFVPALPFIAIISAIGLVSLIDFLITRFGDTQPGVLKYYLCAVYIITAIPYSIVFQRNYNYSVRQSDARLYNIGNLIKEAGNGTVDLRGYKICFNGNTPNVWADLKIVSEKGVEMPFRSVDKISVGDKLIVWQESVMAQLYESHNISMIKEENNIHFLEVR